jgi:hypothetical protein
VRTPGLPSAAQEHVREHVREIGLVVDDQCPQRGSVGTQQRRGCRHLAIIGPGS